MGPIDIAVIVVVCVAVLGVAGYMIYRKIRHKPIGCDCSSCDGCRGCNRKKDEDKK